MAGGLPTRHRAGNGVTVTRPSLDPQRTMAGLLGRLALAMASLVLTLLALEAVSRVAVPQWQALVPQRLMTTDRNGGLAGVPNFDGRVASLYGDFDVALQFDARGFRNPPGADPAAPLAFVGDSFCQGWGITPEESFPAVAAAQLGVPFYNYCAIGADLRDELGIVRTWLPKGRHATTVLTITFENDVLAYPASPDDGTATDAVQGLSRNPVSCWLMNHSALFDVATTLARQSTTIVAFVHRTGLMSGVPVVASSGAESIAASVRMVEQIHAAVGDGPFVVLVVPPRPGQVEFLDYDAFVAALRRAGFDVIDPRAEPGVKISTIPHDGHWDAATHAVIGHRLAEHLAAIGVR